MGLSTPRPERTLASFLSAAGVDYQTQLFGGSVNRLLLELYVRDARPVVLYPLPKDRGVCNELKVAMWGSLPSSAGSADNRELDETDSGQSWQPEPKTLLTMKAVEEFSARSANALRKWSDAILAEHRGDAELLSETLQWLNEGHLSILPSSKWTLKRPGTATYIRIYRHVYLIKCFLVTSILRKDADLLKCLKGACQIVLPPHVASICENLLGTGEMPVPHKSTISRFRLSYDVGSMLVMRKVNAVEVSEAWDTISEFDEEYMKQLHAHDDGYDDDDETGERFNIPESILSAEEFVRKEARKHTLPTGGAGARHMSVEHKLSTQWHMIRLQVRRLILHVLIYLLCN